MIVKGEKIRELIEDYGKANSIAEKSVLRQFSENFELNYTQWSNYIRGEQNLGLKPIEKLMEIFPNMNLNWLLRDEGEKYINLNTNYSANEQPTLRVADNESEALQKITLEIIYEKLQLMHQDIKEAN